jgi:hypothetical protein
VDDAKLNQLGNPTVAVTGAISDLSNWNSVASVSKTFTVTDPTFVLNRITATAHAITAATGVSDAQQVFLTTSGTLPGGLSASTQFAYFARVIDANTLTLHTSPIGAVDGSDEVDITSAGTGTQTLTYRVQVWGRPVIFNATTSKYEEGIVHPAYLPEMQGATASANGVRGTVPQPLAVDYLNYLRADGVWAPAPTSVGDQLYSFHNFI